MEKYLKANNHRMTVEDVTTEDIRGLLTFFKEVKKYSQSSINSQITHLKVFFNYLVDNEIITKNPLEKIKKGKVDENPIIPFTDEQVKMILKQPYKSQYVGFRNYVLMRILADTGARIGEILEVRLKDINYEQQSILLNVTKNRKPRMIIISDNTTKELKRFVDTYLDEDETDYLFLNQDNKQLQKRTVQDFIKKYGEDAGIKNVRLSPHTFRHYFAITCIKGGISTSELRKRLGHSTLNMVEKYLYWSDTDLIEHGKKFTPLQNLNI